MRFTSQEEINTDDLDPRTESVRTTGYMICNEEQINNNPDVSFEDNNGRVAAVNIGLKNPTMTRN